jgi:D-alanine-D-alanine ligase-like ATP-grasp enzyme
VARAATTAYAALGLTGSACVDLRLMPDGRPVVLEANPNPDLHPESDTALSARAAGIPYDAFVESVLREALRRR